VRLQILTLLLDGPIVSRKIIEACNATKVTTYKYLDELCDEGKVVWRPQRKRGQSTYELAEEGKIEANRLLKTQQIMARINKWTPQKIEEFMKFLDFLADSKEGEEFWLWLPDLEHAECIKKFRYVETKVLRQD
jgi:predicted transcriptional regulator